MPCSAHCGGADVVIDGLGDAAREENLAALARRGHWISLGQASGPLPPLEVDRLLAKSLSVLAAGGVRLRRPTPAELQERAAAGLARAGSRRAAAAGHRTLSHSTPRGWRTSGSNRARAPARWCWSLDPTGASA
jgi:NADPH:quinone reductase-like Zn-dependent oxidoreductase